MSSLDKRWKELVFAASGFGANFLMVLMGAYFTDAVNPAALGSGQTYQAIMSGTCFILPVLFPILFAIGKIFDGVIDIPFAYITDTLKTKWGRRRPPIAVCFLPMLISYALCWIPVFGPEGQLGNSIWIFFWSILFFASYTMCLIAFYGSLSTVCSGTSQRLRVSSYKSFFDTISYCLVYALVPLLLDSFKMPINKFVFCCLPLMLTMLIPLFLIKEGEKYGYPELQYESSEKISILQSLKLTFGNRLFRSWIYVNCCTFFGLQMFLVAMNAMIIGGMGFSGSEMAILNTCAFGPVPIMLYLFTKLRKKIGVRPTYQSCLLSFAVAILSFFFASKFVCGENKALQFIIACTGGVLGSWAIGAFFMMPYLIPSQISSVEEKLTGINHSAMYFAANAVTSSIIGAISSTLVYENIKMLFVSRGSMAIVYAADHASAAAQLGASAADTFNFGTMLVPFIVFAACVAGFGLCFKMPKDFTPVLVAKELKKQYPDLDISSVAEEKEDRILNVDQEYIPVQIGMCVLSFFLFGFIWAAFLLRSAKKLTGKGNTLCRWLICCLIPFGGAYMGYRLQKELKESTGITTGPAWLYIFFGILFPILPLNLTVLCMLQYTVNRSCR